MQGLARPAVHAAGRLPWSQGVNNFDDREDNPMARTRAALVIFAVALAMATQAMAASTDAQKCEAAKDMIAEKYYACLLKARAKSVLRGQPADYSKCGPKFNQKWGAAELMGMGACPDNVTVTADMNTYLANQAADAAAIIAGTPGTGPHFVDNGDGTITDHRTHLMWEKKEVMDGAGDRPNLHDADNHYRWACLDGIDWCQPDAASSATCLAGVQGDPYDSCAVCTGGCTSTTIWGWVNQLNAGMGFAGHQDWRVPTRLELETILDWSTYSPMVDVAFNGASCGASCTNINDPTCSCT